MKTIISTIIANLTDACSKILDLLWRGSDNHQIRYVIQRINESEMMEGSDYPPNWVVLPGSLLTAELAMREWTEKPVIEICGNREGFVSLGNLLLWISLQSDTESLSITGLPFVHAKSALSLTVVQPMHGSDSYGKLVRVDKDQQFQWLIKDEVLKRQAINLIDLGLSIWFYPEGNHSHANLGPDAEYELFFYVEANT